MTRISKITLIVLLALIASFLIAKHRYPGKPPATLPPGHCDPDLWSHVSEKERLHVIAECTAVEGRVVSLHPASDGDLHIALNPENKSVLNLVNVLHAHGELVVEIICEHPPADANKDDQAACGTFHSQITIPYVGDRVRITGAYVTDRDNGWNEVHPVTSIEILR